MAGMAYRHTIHKKGDNPLCQRSSHRELALGAKHNPLSPHRVNFGTPSHTQALSRTGVQALSC
jgi:hypothetical protein